MLIDAALLVSVTFTLVSPPITAASLVPVMVMVSVLDEVAPLASTIM